MTAEAKTVSARTLAGMLRSRIERAAEHKSETVSLGQFFADQIHRYLTEAGHGPEHDARIGDVPADGGDPDRDRGRDWGLRARQVHLEALSKRAAGGKWFASTNGADGLARLDNGTDGMFPIRGEWHEIEFVEALVNAYRHGDLATPAPRTDGGMTAGEDHAWTFERTRTYLLAELERLRADLHTIGEDLTGEQGKAASWLDVATGRVANVSSVLASATPAQPAGAVPDGLRALSEAATKGEWYTESEKCDGSYGSGEDCGEGYLAYSILTDAEPRYGNPGVIAETSNSTLGVIHEEADEDGFTAWDETARANTAFIVAAVNFVRTLLASHPAGQSAGSGAETDALVDRFSAALKVKLRAAEAKYGWKNGWLKSDWQVECQNGLLRHVGKGDPLDVAAYAAFCWHHGWPSASRRSTDLVTGAVIPTAGAIAAYETRYPDGSLSETSDNTIEAWNRVAAAVCLAEKPAPDSTSTGAAETVAVPVEPTPGMVEAGYRNSKGSGNIKGVYSAMLAARPEAPSDAGWRDISTAAPEAQGAWSFDMEAAPRDGTPINVARDNGCGWDLLTVWWSGSDTEYPWHTESGAAYPEHRFDCWARLPAPPDSSGQGGR
ncbi:hypothetical protein LPC10_01915 [Methylorubrum sp. B1-46]|uniref:hypothetical protein n=1 Tax=Methylorubrum sp. B1-46 TaxID=2897334 RepID=UPI001E4058AC|nr:hypothetical protein [Methylorubrum sp. B1-46]UGB26397.1 hypothetical protein LPC10_01915 [Methylorubrum sp. B1-46]